MTDAEVRQLLQPVRHATVPTKKGNSAYTFYGFGEFVTVAMAKMGEECRVSKVDHEPDGGPIWDRFRRDWERRFR
jgi:hypothetical protein